MGVAQLIKRLGQDEFLDGRSGSQQPPGG
jgi:hypothetical protein